MTDSRSAISSFPLMGKVAGEAGLKGWATHAFTRLAFARLTPSRPFGPTSPVEGEDEGGAA